MKTNRPLPALKKQVGIWIRVSTEDQALGDSPKHHEMRARAYAESRDWDVREVYDLAGVSGKSVVENAEAKRMMEDVRKGHIQGLIFSKLARLARNTRELLDFADFFQKHHADLISLQENIDTGTPSGRLFYTMIAAMAQWEREEITDRVRATVAIRAKSGKPLNGKPIFGYHVVDGKIQPHPDEAPVRKLIYELFAEHKRMKTVARLLNERGLRIRKSRPFTACNVEYYLRDTTAKGEYRSNYTQKAEDKRRMILKPEHTWVVNSVPPIVAPELWNLCNGILDDRKAYLKSRVGPKAVHPFAGFIHCHCGNKMYVKDNTPKYVCRKCRTKIPIVDMDALFHEHLTGYFMSPEKVAHYAKSANDFIAEQEALLASLKTELRTVRDDVEMAFELYRGKALTIDQFKAKHDPLDAHRAQLEEEIPKAEAAIAVAKVDEMSTEQIITDAKQLYEEWPKMTPKQKRNIVELLVRQIVIREGEVEINFIYRPSLQDMGKSQSSHRRPRRA